MWSPTTWLLKVVFINVELSSHDLHNIVLQIHEAEIWGDPILHNLHVMGVRKKEMGIGGIQCGNFLELSMVGQNPMRIIP